MRHDWTIKCLMRDLILLKFVRNQKYNRPNFDDSGFLLNSLINKRFEISWNRFTQYRIVIGRQKYNESFWMPHTDSLLLVKLRNDISTIFKRCSMPEILISLIPRSKSYIKGNAQRCCINTIIMDGLRIRNWWFSEMFMARFIWM